MYIQFFLAVTQLNIIVKYTKFKSKSVHNFVQNSKVPTSIKKYLLKITNRCINIYELPIVCYKYMYSIYVYMYVSIKTK